MKNKIQLRRAILSLLLILVSLPAFGQGTAFTYQGRLNTNGISPTGNYDFTFALFTAANGGSQIGSTVTDTAVPVSAGLFTVTNDFGAVFNGATNWLQIGVRSNGSGSAFTTLSPRQQLTPTPYALFAESANASGLTGTLPAAQLPAGVVTNNESGVTLSNLTVSGNLTLPTIATIYYGVNTLLYADTFQNFFAGQNAGTVNAGGVANTGVGYRALNANTDGSRNTAFGNAALVSVNESDDNTAIGCATLSSITTGQFNTAIGSAALENCVQAAQNTAIGYGALTALNNNANSTANIALGFSAGKNLTSGSSNIYIGNMGNSTESGIIRIGTTGIQTTTYLVGTVNVPVLAITGGSDLAEPFQISAPDKEPPQGAVMVIDDINPGHLKLSDHAYDSRVAGIISGANGIHPGIQMQQQGLLEGGQNVALTGRVYVQADTSNGAIRPGDLLTTSTTPGRAMKVTDHARAQGAILGKAMTRLAEGQGMVLVLVTLQ